MDIKAIQALQGYANSKGAAQSGAAAQNATGAGQAFRDVAEDFTKTLANAEATAMNAMTSNADPHALVEALANTQLAVETAVTVRDRVVEAYQEILRMPV